jgi:phytanoyl-CoA hydroxylase
MVLGARRLRRAERAQWDAKGFLVLEGFFRRRRVERINELVDRLWVERDRPDNPLVIDVFGGPLGNRRMRFRDAPDDARSRPYKLNDLYLESEEVRALVLDRKLVAVLRDLLGGEPAVCNSLNFERGSEQDYHFDTYYMPGPATGALVVTSVCLEDVHPDAGPLTYFPGSHRIPPYRFSHGGVHAVPEELEAATEYAVAEMRRRGLVAEDFCGHAGDVFVWHEQLYHGGRVIADPERTRRSLVTHYWRTDDLELDPGWAKRQAGRHAWYLERAHQHVPA